jgi:hypothetical protein
MIVELRQIRSREAVVKTGKQLASVGKQLASSGKTGRQHFFVQFAKQLILSSVVAIVSAIASD